MNGNVNQQAHPSFFKTRKKKKQKTKKTKLSSHLELGENGLGPIRVTLGTVAALKQERCVEFLVESGIWLGVRTWDSYRLLWLKDKQLLLVEG